MHYILSLFIGTCLIASGICFVEAILIDTQLKTEQLDKLNQLWYDVHSR